VSTGLLKSSLASGLRLAAKEAVEEIGDGVAFVFATAGDSILDVRLRAASGFDSAEEAQTAASRLLPRVREVLSDDGATPGPLPAHEALGRSGAGGLCIHPLRENGHLHGALVVGSPTPLSPERCSGLGRLAAELTLRFDHARLLAECARLRQQLASRGTLEDEKSEEVLKLSEALFAQDIELLRNNEKLGKIERLKNDFIEKMSRELRTPLNSIIEAIISVLTGEDDKLSDDAKSVLRSALDDGTSFLRTLQNILDLWKIKQAELPVEIQDVNFCELVDEAIFSVQDTIGEKPLVVTPKLEATFPRFRTDLAKVNQILFLLLDNADRRGHAPRQRSRLRRGDLSRRPAVRLRRVLPGRRAVVSALSGRRSRPHAGAGPGDAARRRRVDRERRRARDHGRLHDPRAAGLKRAHSSESGSSG
jgi:hypothetical protein